MYKLSLRKRIKFWRKNKIWLTKEKYSNIEFDGIQEYIGVKQKKNHYIISQWIAENIEGEVEITQISKGKKDILQYCTGIDNEIYLFGTEGIFYKKKDEKLENIFNGENLEGIILYPEISAVFILCREGKDFVGRIHSGKIDIVLECDSFLFVDENIKRRDIIKKRWGNAKVLVEDKERILYWHISANENYKAEIKFDNYESAKSFICGSITKAYSYKRNCNVLVSLVNEKEKVHFEYDILEAVEDPAQNHLYYYTATKAEDDNIHILKYTKERECYDLGIAPKGKYWYYTSICGVEYFKMFSEKGVVLLAIYNYEIKYEFYKRATDVKLTISAIMEDSSVIEIKPVLIFEQSND